MAYSFNLLAVPNILSALLTFVMLYLLLRFGAKTGPNRVLAGYVFFAGLISLSWALITVSKDDSTAAGWTILSYMAMVAIFPLQIHFLLLYMQKGRRLTGHRYGPAALYALAILHVLLGWARGLFAFLFLFWIGGLALTLVLSAQSMRREQNAILRAQKKLVLLFLAIPFIWVLLYAFGGGLLGRDITWTAGFFMSASAAVALYAMLRNQLLNTEIVYRSGLAIFITSIIVGVAFLVTLRTIMALFAIRTTAEQSLLAFFIVVIVVWFFKPLYDAGTRLLEWMAPDLKWKESRLEQVFLMYHTGLRIASAKRTDTGIDEDLAGSMLTAVQDFVKETFRAEKGDSIRTINLGQFKLLVEHLPPIYMAIVFTGDETPELRSDVRAILKKVLDKHAKRLERWDGDRAGLEDVEALLKGLLPKSGPGVKPSGAAGTAKE